MLIRAPIQAAMKKLSALVEVGRNVCVDVLCALATVRELPLRANQSFEFVKVLIPRLL